MKKMKKALMLTGAGALVATASIFGTLAYLTDTKEVDNTFTVGNVSIILDEADTNEYGQKLDKKGNVADKSTPATDYAKRVTENEYKLIPGAEYSKDPTITIKKGSEPCFLFVEVNNGITSIETAATIATQMENNGWFPVTGETDVYYYNGEVDARKADITRPVFTTFTINNSFDEAGFEALVKDSEGKVHVSVTAYAVQSNGFDEGKDVEENAAAAWAASFGKVQNTPEE